MCRTEKPPRENACANNIEIVYNLNNVLQFLISVNFGMEIPEIVQNQVILLWFPLGILLIGTWKSSSLQIKIVTSFFVCVVAVKKTGKIL